MPKIRVQNITATDFFQYSDKSLDSATAAVYINVWSRWQVSEMHRPALSVWIG